MKIFIYCISGLGVLFAVLIATQLWEMSDVPPAPVREEQEYIAPIISTNPLKEKDFSDVMSEPPTPAFEKVLETVYPDAYALYPCSANPEGEKVVLLTAKYFDNGSDSNFGLTEQAVKTWEKGALSDIGEFIFPAGANFDSTQTLTFIDVPVTNEFILPTKLRRATAVVDGKQTTVHYGWVLNYVMFASSQQCLERVMESVYGVH